MHITHIELEPFVERTLRRPVEQPTFLSFDDIDLVAHDELDADDPVRSLLCRTVDDHITAVGICAPASTSKPGHASIESADQTVVHIVHRSGTALTVLSEQGSVRTFGPTTEPQHGRVPDACRRILGLPTAPPTDSMTDFVIAAWLEIIARVALQTPELSWHDIVALHPAGSSVVEPTTPTAIAHATKDLGRSLQWERFRKVIATVGGFPFGDSAMETAAWMDAGMFSRWAMDSLPSRSDAFDLLEAVLGPATFDRLWATIRFCE
ncbi:unannotated protein [freshwater metagenome]|jgi:hypothetical protein|uniref:Unannotated protein n=1 Tax=freshwater metagenome TaxID=449393 RepID=A0A6J7IYM7_9ZZZZ|nr:hypothetical protein [Actinomycetota bacterium]MSZ23773.1 hypothetical protein [Actinomycetota bacterium]MSZ92857.1 hypothetical protein [Actinomycetota bacterium]